MTHHSEIFTTPIFPSNPKQLNVTIISPMSNKYWFLQFVHILFLINEYASLLPPPTTGCSLHNQLIINLIPLFCCDKLTQQPHT